MISTTLLDKPLGDLRQEINDLRQINILHDYDINKLHRMISRSRDSLKEAGSFQQLILDQLQQFEISLADINEILRANAQQRAQLEQQREADENDLNIRARLMSLNAEALECRAAAVQLQQDARLVLARANELERRANDELAQQAIEMKIKQQEIERNRTAELERRVRAEEERQKLKELQIQQDRSSTESTKKTMPPVNQSTPQDQYANWIARDFMHDDQNPPCIIRLAPNSTSIPIKITYVNVVETEFLLDHHEELVGTPLQVNFHSENEQNSAILLAIPYLVKRSTHRENIIKIRQANGTWIPLDCEESLFDSHKEKRFIQCRLVQSSTCAVVSRLKREAIRISSQSSGRFQSTADPRLTLQWPENSYSSDLDFNLRMQPVDLTAFNHFCQQFSLECQGLISVGPIIDLNIDEISLSKPIQMMLPMLVQTKKKVSSTRVANVDTNSTNNNSSQSSQQDLIFQQQQSIFRSMLGEDSNNERLMLIYWNAQDNNWQIDSNVRITDSKTHDIVTTHLKQLHGRMMVVRCDKQLMTLKKIQKAIDLLEKTLSQRSVSFLLRRREDNPNQICLVCYPSHRSEIIARELKEENYTDDEEQVKEVILFEGELLELRFRGNVLPIDCQEKSCPFAFNTFFPFYFEANVAEVDRYSQHLSPSFYGFIQIFSKRKILKTNSKENEKKKSSNELLKQEWIETDICHAELVIRLPKLLQEQTQPVPRALPIFSSEGILTPALFREISGNLTNEQWRALARRLGMTQIRVEAIEHDYPDDTCYFMLLAWFKRVPRSADKVNILIQALIAINRWNLAQMLQNLRDEKRQEQILLSREEQMKLLRMPFNRICQREECVRVWKRIARELTLTTEDISTIEQQYPSRQERCLRSLEAWTIKDNQADIPTLARSLRFLGFKSLAREIEQLT